MERNYINDDGIPVREDLREFKENPFREQMLEHFSAHDFEPCACVCDLYDEGDCDGNLDICPVFQLKQKKAQIQAETIDTVIQYLNKRFDDQHYCGSWYFQDGTDESEDVGYAWEWWVDCGVKELQFLKEKLSKI